MNVVPRQNTPLGAEAATAAVRTAFESVMGRSPSGAELAGLMALVWIETARGKSIQNNNFGNITAGASYSGSVWRPPWFEVTDASSARDKSLHELMKKGQAPSAFRAYPTAAAGALDYVRILKSSFPNVLEVMKEGDGEALREELSKAYSGDYKNPDSGPNLQKLIEEFGGSGGGSGFPWGWFAVGTVAVVAGVFGWATWKQSQATDAEWRAKKRKVLAAGDAEEIAAFRELERAAGRAA